MSFISVRQLPVQEIKAGFVQRDEDITDFGGCSKLFCDGRFFKNGTGAGKIVLQHSASGEPGSFFDIPDVGWVVAGTGTRFVVVGAFLRYVRAAVDGEVLTNPVVGLDIIGRD